MDDCVFCKIIKGEIPSYKIYEDDKYLAFLDIRPISPGHTVVIPKEHCELVWDVDNSGEYFEICKKIAKSFQEKSGNKYVYSFIHGEGVPHAHIHLIPAEDPEFGKKFSQALNSIDNVDKLSENDALKVISKYKFTI